MQLFIEANPRILIQHFAVGRGAWVKPKQRLGSEYEADFLIAQQGSGGLIWYAVELERPQAILFTKKGDPSAALTHALRQINDWREWLSRNRGYAAQSREKEGLGLIDIHPELDGLIIMGRGADIDTRTTARRRRLARDYRVEIETYDWLLSEARERFESRQTDLARAANDIKTWQELLSVSDGEVPGPVWSTYVSNIDRTKYPKTGKYLFADLTDDIPSKFDGFIAKVEQILRESNARLKYLSYDKTGDYLSLTPSGFITRAQLDRIEQAGKYLPVQYLLQTLVYPT
jgi:Shedu protein SduA, C-terminal